MKRSAVFARQGWYPWDEAQANRALSGYLVSEQPPAPALAVLAPHAGWMYSGPTAGRLYAEVEVPKRVVLLCPAHQRGGPAVAVWARGEWETPLGDIPVDECFTDCFLQHTPQAVEDYDSHRTEHAIEVQLPFLKARNPELRIVPVRLGHLGVREIDQLAQSIAACILRSGEAALIVASTDMSHETSYERVQNQDARARQAVASGDYRRLVQTVETHGITMCGYIPAAVALAAARHQGGTRIREVAYATSADISGRTDYVVGYLAARIDR